ncbi:hypothetical protein [Streptomyces sp. NPDC026092]|uniref:hypothetical protein n=1 Tax=Streptomyces sp. NPDC026092 TaxID=3154797 RepID=UPI0033D7769F
MTPDERITELARVETIEQFVKVLKALHQSAGNPSLRDMQSWAKWNSAGLPRSSVNDVLSGKRPPRGDLLNDVLRYYCTRPGTGVSQDEVAAWHAALARLPRPTRAGHEQGPVAAERFFTEMDDVGEVARLISEAETEVWLLGTTLGMHIPYLKEEIKLSVENGVRFKVLLIERDSAAMTMAHLRAGPRADLEEMREGLDTNIAALSRIAHQVPGQVEVRVIDYLAPYTLYAYDPDGRSGRMDLRLGSFHGKHTLRPTFTVEADRDADWFVYFYKQFTSTWSVARQVVP